MCPKSITAAFALALAFALVPLAAQAGPAARASGPEPTGRVEWQEVPEARAYLVSVRDSSGRLVLESRTEDTHLDLDLEPGRYLIKITALNKFLKAATESSWTDLVIARAVRPVVDSVAPAVLASGGKDERLELAGSGLSAETRVSLVSRGASYEGRHASEDKTGSVLLVSFDLGPALPGAYDLVVENPGNQRVVLGSALSLLPPESYSPLAWPGKARDPGLALSAPKALPLPVLPAPGQKAAGRSGALPAGPGQAGEAASEEVDKSQSAPGRESAPGAAKATGTARAFPRPPARGLWLEAGWTAGLLLDDRMAARYGVSYGGGELALVAPATILRACPDALRILALELRADGNYYPGQGTAAGKASYILGGATLGLVLRSDFAFPVNVSARLGGGLAVSYLSSTSVIASGADLSYDPALRAGLGLRVSLGAQYLELGAEYLWVSYVDKAQGMARGGLLFGLDLLP